MEYRILYVEEEEKSLEITKTDAEKIRDICEGQFGSAVPMLKKAIKSLKKLSKGEMTELKSIKKPTLAVYTLMKCVCILMDIPPTRSKVPGDSMIYEEDYWQPSISKKVLNNFSIVEILSNYNPEMMNKEIMIKLDKAT
jgi:dynein heavy chain